MKKMKSKQGIGAILVVVGVIAILFSQYIKGRVGGEMGKVRAMTGALSHGGEGGRMAGGILENNASGQAAGYLQNAQFLTVGGIALIIVGGVMVFLYGKKK